MHVAHTKVLDARTLRMTFSKDGSALSFVAVFALLRNDADFRTWFNQTLSEVPFAAMFWELPPLTRATLGNDFECVFVDAPALGRMVPEPDAFAAHFREDALVVTFDNLGGDSRLVAPTLRDSPAIEAAHYTHLAAFVRHAPADQRDALWALVGKVVCEQVSDNPLWLSTSGLGIGWLHVRLDPRPKYYDHQEYTSLPGGIR